ncbi:MAG: acylneuraminate cytidylyltransferase family protein [Bacteroidia bacterium]|nr:acylneuraminate cytidylyltransferase family protein [Bacteroidia bacterium]
MYNILGIIPARGGSKRIPYKNKKLLAGKELIRYAVEATLQSKLVTTVVVSSDDTDILNIARSYAHVIAIQRPDSISDDNAPSISYVHHALELLKNQYDYVVIIQPSSPFTLAEDIDNTIQLLIDDNQADSSVSVMKLDHTIHPVKLKTLFNNQLIPFWEEEKGRMATHELPELYVLNCSVYVSKFDLIKRDKIIGEHCLGYIMPRERSIDINDPIDFDFAEFLMSYEK